MSQASVHHAAPPQLVRRDVYSGVWKMGDGAVTVGAAIGLTVALILHGMGVARAIMSLSDMLDWLRGSRREIATYYYETYEVEVREPEKVEEKKPDPPPEPAPDPEPAPKPEPTPQAKPVDDPYKDAPPPAAAKAQEILTQKTDDPLDFSQDGFVSGKGPGGIGYVSSEGTADKATSPKAQVGGDPKGTGTTPGAAVQGPPPPDLSKPPTISGSSAWNCPFPPEADAAQVDQATATIVVTVRPDGSPQSVSVTNDPGNGFGRAARTCALGRKYKAGLDKAGQPTTATTPPIRVRFTR